MIDTGEFEEQKRIHIAKHRRAIANDPMLFKNGEIEADEYYRQKDDHERQMSYWESRTSDRQQITLELTTAQALVDRLQQFWDVTGGDDQRMLAHSLFDEIIYDLDAQQITNFKIKAWADPFVQLRASLYADEMSEEMKNRFNSGFQGLYRIIAPTGSELIGQPIPDLVNWFMSLSGFKQIKKSFSRDELIRLRHAAGERLSDLAREFGISTQRVFQIVQVES